MSNRKIDEYICGAITLDDSMLEPGYDWSQHHTRELLEFLRCQDGRENPAFNKVLKEVLSTREHIPTVKQAKELRKKKAKEKQNR